MTGSTSLRVCIAHPRADVRYLYFDGRAHVFECPDCSPPAIIRIQPPGSVAGFKSRVRGEGVKHLPDRDRDVCKVVHDSQHEER